MSIMGGLHCKNFKRTKILLFLVYLQDQKGDFTGVCKKDYTNFKMVFSLYNHPSTCQQEIQMLQQKEAQSEGSSGAQASPLSSRTPRLLLYHLNL